MVLVSTLFGTVYGFIVGFIWCYALRYPILSWITYGCMIAYGGFALYLAIMQRIVEVQMKFESRAQTKRNGTTLFLLLISGVITGLIALVIRLIFF